MPKGVAVWDGIQHIRVRGTCSSPPPCSGSFCKQNYSLEPEILEGPTAGGTIRGEARPGVNLMPFTSWMEPTFSRIYSLLGDPHVNPTFYLQHLVKTCLCKPPILRRVSLSKGHLNPYIVEPLRDLSATI